MSYPCGDDCVANNLLVYNFTVRNRLGIIVDFYAPKAKLVIEIDGSQHLEVPHIEKDRERDEYLGRLGLMVLRINGRQVLKETEAVVEFIYQAITKRLT
jgi:very-short-patch-repair endonuclease